MILALWAFVTAACSPKTEPDTAVYVGPRLAYAVQAGNLSVTASCGTLGAITLIDAHHATVPWTAPSTIGSCTVTATRLTDDSTATGTYAVNPPSIVQRGVPYGPFHLWSSYTTVQYGPTPFTTSIQSEDYPPGVVTRIGAARSMGQKLILGMPGLSHTPFLTNGAFDLGKWKAAMDRFNTTTVRQAVADGVADGTVIGNAMIDEPEHKSWGGVITKAMLDQMATYAKQYFPTLPMGVNRGPPAYQWRATERYHVVDYVMSQYNWSVNKGDVVSWRQAVMAQDALDGVRSAFSLNLLDGGVQDTDGTYDCTGTGQAGLGTFSPNCRMTASEMTAWGKALVASGCLLSSWTYDATFFGRSDNQAGFKAIADSASRSPRPPCTRP